VTSAAILTALLSLAGVLVGAGLQYAFGRTLEVRKQLILQKGQAYADYFRAVAAAAKRGSSSEVLALVADAKMRICIYGSPAVVRCLYEFERAGAATDSEAGHAAIAELLASMRRDMGMVDASISQADLRHIVFGAAVGGNKAH
jgi:hypothetical protein